MSKMRFVFIVAFISAFTLATAQGTDANLVKADKEFIRMDYASAAGLYEKYLKKNPKDFYASRQAAISYGKLSDQNKAIDHWTNVMESSQATDRDRLEYAKSLLANYRTDDAKRVLTSLRSSSDPLAAMWGKAYSEANEFTLDSALCQVQLLDKVNSDKPEYAPVYYKDHLLFVTEPKNSTTSYIYSAERYEPTDVDKGKPFNKHIQKKNINGAFSFTPDDSTLYFTRTLTKKETKKKTKNKNATSIMQIFYTAMNSYGLAHEEIKPFLYNSLEYNCMHPAFSPDGKKLYFVSDMPGTLGGKDIFVCEWKDGAWDKPKNLGPNINTPGNEIYPHVTEEGLLYFASDGWPGMGGLDLFYSDPTKDGGFTQAENLGATMNSQFNDYGMFVMKKGKGNKGYFSSNRKNGTKDDNIYYFVNDKPRSFPAKIRFFDSLEAKSMNVTFTLNVPSGTYEEKLDSAKIYIARVRPGKSININASADTYITKNFFKNPVTTGDSIITVQMNPKSRKCIEGRIMDKDNNKPLAGVKVAIYDEEGNKYLDYVTDSTGIYSICNLPLDKPLYIGSQKKPDYFSNTDKFFIRKGEDLLKDIQAIKIVVGKSIKIDNIYFDAGKFNVRPDAALELDKLVRLMKDNPEVIIELSSHTDCNGAAAANLALSDKRAKSAAAYITSKGVAKNRIKGKGYGESKLVNDCKCEGKKPSTCSDEQHAQNRRAEIKVTGFVEEKPIVQKTVKKKGK